MADFMALVRHALWDFGSDFTEKPLFSRKYFSKSLCHGVDIIGIRQNKILDKTEPPPDALFICRHGSERYTDRRVRTGAA